MSGPARDVAVIGAGPAGLAVALMLARQGRRVVIHERFDAARPVGAGFMLQPTGLDVLDRLGLSQAIEARGAPIDRLFGCDARRGRVVLDVRYGALARPHRALGVHRAALFRILHDACQAEGVPIVTGWEAAAAQDGRITTRDGRVSARFDLVVDASGARSAVAAGLAASGPLRRRRDLAWGALWTTTPWPGAPFDPAALEQVYRAADRMIGVLPCGTAPESDTPLATFFWSLKPADHDAWRAGGLDRWKAEVLDLWPQAAPVLDAIADPEALTLARYGHHTLDRPAAPRLAVIGDAAHAASPQLGQGVNMALLDAQALADALARHANLDAALGAYVAARRRHVRLYQALSLAFTPFYQADGRFRPWVRDHLLGRVARLPFADRLLAATVGGLLLDPRPRRRDQTRVSRRS